MSELDMSVIPCFLRYEPETGLFYWTKMLGRRNDRLGKIAGNRRKDGYVIIRICHRNYLAHRLAFVFMLGRWPNVEADHKDRDPSNNRWSNLRDADNAQQSGNSRRPRHNRSGLKGVSFDSRKGFWQAQIGRAPRHKWLGYFDTAEAASLAYAEEAKARFGEFAHTGN